VLADVLVLIVTDVAVIAFDFACGGSVVVVVDDDDDVCSVVLLEDVFIMKTLVSISKDE